MTTSTTPTARRARTAKQIGIRPRRGGWQAHVKINHVQYTKQYAADTPVADMLKWRDEQIAAHEGEVAPAGSFAADIATYTDQIKSKPTGNQIAAHLALWADALGGTRARRTITTVEINAVIDTWLVTLEPGTVRKRRTSLLGLFNRLDGKAATNAVRGAQNPTPPREPEARAIDYGTIGAILAAVPRWRSVKRGTPPLAALGYLRLAVMAYTGIPPGMLQKVTAGALTLGASPKYPHGCVYVTPRRKGKGVSARTLPLTAAGRDAFKAFAEADAFGAFAIESLNRSFKKAAGRVGLDPTRVHLYDLRHSFGTEMYRVTRDLATVARFMLHSEGSPLTARYAAGANAEVDAAAVASFDKGQADVRRAAMALARNAATGDKVTAKGDRAPKLLKKRLLAAEV